ncbi:MAG TPA: helix-turn-helix domain-containing protein [Gemmatimonadaceae bacterium]|nr:helix-turn-helix domain-containing protein [Gemmatimonadaceae bacterium]
MPPYIATSLRQILVLASPGREDIIDAVAICGPAPVSELSEFLGRSRHSLYYHLRALRDAGLLIETLHPAKGKKTTARYDLPGRPMIVRYDLSSKRSRNAVIKLGHGRFRAAERGFIRACHPDVAVVEGPRRNLWVAHLEGWLTDSDLESANELFARLIDLFKNDDGTSRAGRKPYAVTWAISPVLTRNRKPRG